MLLCISTLVIFNHINLSIQLTSVMNSQPMPVLSEIAKEHRVIVLHEDPFFIGLLLGGFNLIERIDYTCIRTNYDNTLIESLQDKISTDQPQLIFLSNPDRFGNVQNIARKIKAINERAVIIALTCHNAVLQKDSVIDAVANTGSRKVPALSLTLASRLIRAFQAGATRAELIALARSVT